MTETTTPRAARVNAIGLAQADYKGLPSTLCQGCGHNSIANQIVQVAYELNVRPHEMLKLSGIGCSSKSPAYFLGQSFGFNTLHGRMPSLATGALIANHGIFEGTQLAPPGFAKLLITPTHKDSPRAVFLRVDGRRPEHDPGRGERQRESMLA